MTQASAITTSRFAAAPPATRPASPPVILHERWPTLAVAMGQYQQTLAEEFSRRAYACIREGLISGSDRNRLTREATQLGLRPFDAQLLIACTIRQWSLDQPHRRKPLAANLPASPRFPKFSRIVAPWRRYMAVVILAILLDSMIIWYWFL